MEEASPRIRAALEFTWIFTEWWENLDMDPEEDNVLWGDRWFQVEEAWDRWEKAR